MARPYLFQRFLDGSVAIRERGSLWEVREGKGGGKVFLSRPSTAASFAEDQNRLVPKRDLELMYDPLKVPSPSP